MAMQSQRTRGAIRQAATGRSQNLRLGVTLAAAMLGLFAFAVAYISVFH